MTATARSPRRTALAIAALLAVVAAVYVPSLANDLVWDDVAHVVANPRLDSQAGVGHIVVAARGCTTGRRVRDFKFVARLF